MGLLNKFRKATIKNIKEEVAESIDHLLSTKQSFGAWQKDLGLSDYSHANKGEEIIKKMMEDIFLNVKSQEKRFKIDKIRLVFSNKENTLCFELGGKLEGNPEAFFIYVEKSKNPIITPNQLS